MGAQGKGHGRRRGRKERQHPACLHWPVLPVLRQDHMPTPTLGSPALGFPVLLQPSALEASPLRHLAVLPAPAGSSGTAVSWARTGPELNSGCPWAVPTSVAWSLGGGKGCYSEAARMWLVPSPVAGQAVQWHDRGWQGLRHHQQTLREWCSRPVPAVPGRHCHLGEGTAGLGPLDRGGYRQAASCLGAGGHLCWAEGAAGSETRGGGGARHPGSTAVPSEQGVFPACLPQECLQRFGDSLQEMVNYHMVSLPADVWGPVQGHIPLASHRRQPPPRAPLRPRPAWSCSQLAQRELSWRLLGSHVLTPSSVGVGGCH